MEPKVKAATAFPSLTVALLALLLAETFGAQPPAQSTDSSAVGVGASARSETRGNASLPEAVGKSPSALEPPGGLSAPALARMASTVLLVWDRSPSAGVSSYEVYRDGE